MKKIFAGTLAAVTAFSLAACGSSSTADSSAAAQTEAAAESTEAESEAAEAGSEEIETVEKGVLTVATSPDFAPYEFYAIDENGDPHLAGFDMDLAQYIADYLGLQLEVVPMEFDGTIMELQQGNVDLGMAGYSPSEDRKSVMDFSDIYISGGQSFVCLKENADKFKTLEDTNNAEYSIGAQVGSIQSDLAKQYSPDADLLELPKVTDIISDLRAGKMDGAYIETMVAESYAKNYPELEVVLEVPYDAVGSVVGVKKGNTALLNGVNEAIHKCLDDGTFNEYVVKANELASGEIVEGLVEETGDAAETTAAESAETEAAEAESESESAAN